MNRAEQIKELKRLRADAAVICDEMVAIPRTEPVAYTRWEQLRDARKANRDRQRVLIAGLNVRAPYGIDDWIESELCEREPPDPPGWKGGFAPNH